MTDQGRKIDWRAVKGGTKFRGRFYDCHPDQKEIIELAIDKARAEAGTRHDTVALELICQGYLVASPIKAASVSDVLAAYGPEAVLDQLRVVLPEIFADAANLVPPSVKQDNALGGEGQ